MATRRPQAEAIFVNKHTAWLVFSPAFRVAAAGTELDYAPAAALLKASENPAPFGLFVSGNRLSLGIVLQAPFDPPEAEPDGRQHQRQRDRGADARVDGHAGGGDALEQVAHQTQAIVANGYH